MSISWFSGWWPTPTLRPLLVAGFHDPDSIGEPARPPDDVPTVTPHPRQPRPPVARLYPSTVGARPTPPEAVLVSRFDRDDPSGRPACVWVVSLGRRARWRDPTARRSLPRWDSCPGASGRSGRSGVSLGSRPVGRTGSEDPPGSHPNRPARDPALGRRARRRSSARRAPRAVRRPRR